MLSKDLKRKHKLIDREEEIIDFAISPDGKEIYWLNGKEIWKRGLDGEIKLLVKAKKVDTEAIKKRWEKVDWVDPKELEKLEGGIVSFELSPDGKYIAYEEIEDYISCCAGSPNIPLSWIWIIKSDGTEKVKIEKPPGGERNVLVFDKWFPDSKRVLFHFRFLDEPTGGSPFFEVGVDGRNPIVYTAIYQEHYPKASDTITVVGSDPIFLPSGEKMVYREGGILGEGKVWLANIDGTEKIMILKNKGVLPALEIIKWSKDGNLLLINAQPGETFVFNKKGEIIFKRKLDSAVIKGEIFSLNNKYLAFTYLMRKEKIGTISLMDFITKERKEFKLPEIKAPHGFEINPQFFSKNNRLYYFIDPIDSIEEKFLPQLWVIDINNWKDYKIGDNILKVVITSSK